ncbi:MAG: hypothetical protein Q7S82_01795 [bacterium]|nr:hypothetical protein [bacterium]
MDIKYSLLQIQDEKIYSYFRTTTEPFDSLEWDGKVLEVWDKDKIVETYKYKDLINFIINL